MSDYCRLVKNKRHTLDNQNFTDHPTSRFRPPPSPSPAPVNKALKECYKSLTADYEK